ncbi:MAG: hypothetical protein Kow0077_23480 [Anaerolineae bacterium]
MITPDPYASDMQEAYRLAQQGDREGALAILYSVVASAPDHRDAWWLIARAALRRDQQVQAVQAVLRLDPGHDRARELAARLGLDPGLLPPRPVYSAPAPTGEPVPPGSGPPPAPDYVSHPATTPYAEPEPPAPRKSRPRPVATPDRPAGRIQPFLAINGGCASGCLSGLLTLILFAALAFFILSDSVNVALRSVGGLTPGQATPARLIPAIMLTAVLQLLRTNPITIPLDLSGLIPGLDPSMLPQLPSSSEVFSQAMNSLWQSLNYPPYTGDLIIGQMTTVGPQIQNLTWILPLVFFGGWLVLAFLLVFLRARSSRLLNWLISTIGLWIIGGVAYAVALVLYRLFGGGLV